ncbi:DNA mismatch repair protein PMS1 isoform X1 [Histomonas meleagridis]|uniref:DNA mismatch repair protein PMS1 isoform X1 n=1 Tax=Histomonas meleagridis TaxID=135588 RepID=UPI00355A8D64|nr:DNA mismatch repair protein PMS1 isoform X1 [Histomonas meleagridis]KAH0800368.1 DNA mismatch repair protein PMS1 isoform X1 [Histomonas meleagridis]
MKALNQDCINLLSSGQVISGVIDAVKELLENALDSGAKTIKIKLEDQGLQRIVVTDDGCGITPNGRETCGLAYTTSKILSFEDLMNDLTTFGFRGEALHSLCCVGDVEIITRCKDEDTAKKLIFDHNGNILKTEIVAAPQGTSVSVCNLLSVFPVRVREERVNFSVDSLKNLLSRYYLAAPSVRFVIDAPPFLNQTRPPFASLSQAVTYEYGSQVSAALVEKNAETYSGDIKIRMKGLVPSPTCEWKDASTSRMQSKQLLLVNGRPVRNSTIEKKVNEICWAKFGSIPKRFPRYIICIDFYRDNQICSSMMDVNVDPSKAHIIFSEANIIIKLVEQLFENKKQQISFKNIREWPSTFINLSHPAIDIASLGGCVWRGAGSYENYTLFSVLDFSNNLHLIAADLQKLYEKCGVHPTEIGRTDQSEFIVMYWDQLMEIHNESPCVFHLFQLD